MLTLRLQVSPRLNFLVFLLLLWGCNPPAPTANNGQTRIVVTTGMVGDLVQHVAGEHAEVLTLYDAVDPHQYAPTGSDIKEIMLADVVFYSGLHLEGPMADAFEGRSRRGGEIHAVTERLAKEDVRTPEGSEGHPDPHVWHDPILWGQCALDVGEILSEIDPEHAADYRQNALDYQQRLKEIDAFAQQVLGAIPEKQRHLVTAHDAFEYFAGRYGLEVRSIQGISTMSQAGLFDQERLIDFMVENQIPMIFVESTVPEKFVRQVIEGAHVKGWEVQKGDVLYSDAMGTPGTYEGTYIGMLDHNIATIGKGLGSKWEGPFSFQEYEQQQAATATEPAN
ncbi:MAG: zinc ABC transporter substrate-binding protein [Planctomycetaceae bacterium]|nr:zinc ABC transporter substrate-binding protein [Planctomycetaceae bacterium]MCB9950963.1 zinc ABC transporter substrate-binding protein [Planctomycetaceae bacterium]